MTANEERIAKINLRGCDSAISADVTKLRYSKQVLWGEHLAATFIPSTTSPQQPN